MCGVFVCVWLMFSHWWMLCQTHVISKWKTFHKILETTHSHTLRHKFFNDLYKSVYQLIWKGDFFSSSVQVFYGVYEQKLSSIKRYAKNIEYILKWTCVNDVAEAQRATASDLVLEQVILDQSKCTDRALQFGMTPTLNQTPFYPKILHQLLSPDSQDSK